jgi:methylglutaconyl-CoA hydratase
VLPRLLPRPAHELFLTGETFDATTASQIGLLNSAVPGFDLDTEVARYVDMLRRGAPSALAATKELLRRPRPDSMSDQFAEMLQLSASFFAAPEAQEGMAAFAAKRPPSWVPAATP